MGCSGTSQRTAPLGQQTVALWVKIVVIIDSLERSVSCFQGHTRQVHTQGHGPVTHIYC